MGATSIHVQAVKPGSEIHNFREKELDYVRPELSHLNESWVGDSISHRLESAKQRYLDTVGQKMQAKAAPIREGVIVIKQETTMQELQQFATVCKERFGIEAFQIHIHKDEGYMNAKQWTPNLHAHVVFDWTQPNGKSVRLSRDDMAELQTIASEALGMERGVSSDPQTLIGYAVQDRMCERTASGTIKRYIQCIRQTQGRTKPASSASERTTFH